MTYTVATTGMQKYITSKESAVTFDSLEEAVLDFERQCDRLGYDNISINYDGTRDAGGIGHDYRIELTLDAR